MQAERWQKLKEIFHEASERAPGERTAFVAENCDGDTEMGREIARMLAAADDESDDLERNAFEIFNGKQDEPPTQIGKYRIVRELGRGGMGAVYEATFETADFTQRVALKIIKRGMDTDLIVRRFRHEQRILASLTHPNITQFIDGGMTADDRPFYAMEFVEGQFIDDHFRDRDLSLVERLKLFRQVCSAVQYAHQNLIIHRDLKPKNILVTKEGVPKLLDFGIGKILDLDGSGHAGTATQIGMMTPAYASPEQVRGKHIDTTSDIYSLGVILFELLTGQKPYKLNAHSQLEIERAVCETEPRRPSTISSSGEGKEAADDHNVLPYQPSQLRGDLDNIILKCLRKEPAERYASVQALSDDLGRYIEGRPVSARPHTLAYRASKFVRRNRVGVAAAVIVFVSLVIGITAAIWQARRAENQRLLAERRFADVRQLANNVVFKYHDAIAELPGSTAAREMLVRDALAYLDRLEQENTGDVDLQKELAMAYLKMGDVQGKMYNANVGDTEGALASYKKSIGLFESVIAARPDDVEAKDQLIQAYDNLAFLMLRAGGDARAVVEKALALLQQIPPNAGKTRQYDLKLIDLHIRLGDSTSPRTATLAAHEKALPLIAKLIDEGASDYDSLKAIARVYQRIGTDHRWLGIEAEKPGGNSDAAREHYQKSLEFQQKAFDVVERLVALAPDKPESQRYLAAGYGNLAESLAGAGLYDEALRVAGNFMETVQRAAAADPRNSETKLNLSTANEIFAEVYRRRGDDQKAIEFTQRALALDEAIVHADEKNNEVKGRIIPRHKLLAELYQKIGDTQKADFHRERAGISNR